MSVTSFVVEEGQGVDRTALMKTGSQVAKDLDEGIKVTKSLSSKASLKVIKKIISGKR